MFTENLMPDRLEEEAKKQSTEEIYEFGFKPQSAYLPACLPVAQISNFQVPRV